MTRWIAASGAFVVSLDSTVNIAFPAMTVAFAVEPERVRWIIIAYVFSYAITSFVAGALADRVGHGRVFAAGLAGSALAFALAGLRPTFGWLLAPFSLVASRGLAASTAGLLFTLTPLGTTLAAPLAGRVVDRLGARAPVAAGLALEALGLALLSRAGPTSSLGMVALALFAAGFGLGLFQVPNMAQVMAAFTSVQQGAAGGFAFLARTLGTVAGVAVLAQLFGTRRPVIGLGPAAAEAFLATAIAVVVGVVLALATTRD